MKKFQSGSLLVSDLDEFNAAKIMALNSLKSSSDSFITPDIRQQILEKLGDSPSVSQGISAGENVYQDIWNN